MKKSKRAAEKAAKRTPAVKAAFRLRAWHYALGLAAALAAVFWAYRPALHGDFVFDDLYLDVLTPRFASTTLPWLIRSARPLLSITFWTNLKLFGTDPYSYHVVNVLLHFAVSVMVFLAVRKLLEWAGTSGLRREGLAAFAAAVFLLHPVQTESVAYVTSRSEALSVLLFDAAFVVFLYRRREAITWVRSLGILALFLAAVVSKEHTAVLPALLLLTDYYWNPGFSFQGIRRNWRLYAPVALGTVVAARFILRVLHGTDTAGAAVKAFTWYQYFYTQCRVIWIYVRLFFFPYGQTVDYDLAISRTPLDHGAVIGMLALAALAVAAIWYRRRYPLASYGYFVFLILLAPTSSVLSIADPIAERRMYLPMIGLLLVVLEFVRRWKAPPRAIAAALAGCVLVVGVLTYQRSKVWSSAQALWEDAAIKSPHKQRVQLQLGFVYYTQGRCAAAVDRYREALRLGKPDYRLLTEWAVADICLNQYDDALDKLRQAATFRNDAHVNSLEGLVYIQQGRREEALAALATAARINPRFEATYVYRGGLYLDIQKWAEAAAEFRHALTLNPTDERAQLGLAQAEQHLREPH
jgi:tetratricopeptide (TPR) repeat protein